MNLKKINKEMKNQRLFMTITFLITTAILLTLAFWTGKIFTFLGIGFMILAMGILMLYIWRTKQPFPSEQHDLNNQDFVKQNITFLQRGRNLSAKYMPVYAVLLIIGINFTLVDPLFLMELSLALKIAIHVGLSLFMVWFFYRGVQNYLKKYDARTKPMLKELRGSLMGEA